MVTVKTGSLEETRVNRNETGHAAGMAMDQGRLTSFSTHEVAMLFGISPATVCAWASHGVLTPCSAAPYGKEAFLREDISRLLESLWG